MCFWTFLDMFLMDLSTSDIVINYACCVTQYYMIMYKFEYNFCEGENGWINDLVTFVCVYRSMMAVWHTSEIAFEASWCVHCGQQSSGLSL